MVRMSQHNIKTGGKALKTERVMIGPCCKKLSIFQKQKNIVAEYRVSVCGNK